MFSKTKLSSFYKLGRCRQIHTFSKEALIKRYVKKDSLLKPKWSTQEWVTTTNPSNNEDILSVPMAAAREVNVVLNRIEQCKKQLIDLPAPKRGEILSAIRDEIKTDKEHLAAVISLEMGKIYSEALGEVQEFIDICDFAIGLSRQIGGRTFPSERSQHFMMEQYNPIGNVGVISAFNFPIAVFGWNFALAFICGNPVVWKPSPRTSLCSISIMSVIKRVLEKHNMDPAVCSVIFGGKDVGQAMSENKDLHLLSFTGSTYAGKIVGNAVQARMGKSILELGGNNAVIVMNDADIDLAVKSITFGAVGTAGQRCTSVRRLLLHEDIYYTFLDRLVDSYSKLNIGDPFEENVHCGPLISKEAVHTFTQSVKSTTQLEVMGGKGKLLFGGEKVDRPGNFVIPALVEIPLNSPVAEDEIFAPILFIQKVPSLDVAICQNNSVKQGLSSSLFTNSVRDIFRWVGPHGSDCGITNVNIPTNGAEIGGAFGGEKESGMGRESGSDAWKQYCKRQTCTINWGNGLELAQGIRYDG